MNGLAYFCRSITDNEKQFLKTFKATVFVSQTYFQPILIAGQQENHYSNTRLGSHKWSSLLLPQHH